MLEDLKTQGICPCRSALLSAALAIASCSDEPAQPDDPSVATRPRQQSESCSQALPAALPAEDAQLSGVAVARELQDF